MKFSAVPGRMARVPGSAKAVGQAAKYIGHSLDGGEYKPNGAEWSPSNDEQLARAIKLVRSGDIAPVDEEAAAACGVELPAKPAPKAGKASS